MAHFSIREPIWSSRSIGIADNRISEQNTIECTYRTKDGTRLYPDVIMLTRQQLNQYPTQKIKGGVTLRIIPLKVLDEGAEPVTR